MTLNEQISAYNRSLDLLQGKNVRQNSKKAFALNAQAAKENYHDAILAMGWFYIRGIGVKENSEKAKEWYRKSARQGEPKAMFSLGQIAYIEKNFSDSLTWFKRAVKTGHARSLYYIGRQYWNGQGVDRDRKEAMRLFHLAARKKVVEAVRLLKFFRSKKPSKFVASKKSSS
ncbi:MAG: tetratricopeptide repeat protein [Limisphaerales bacterium]